MTRATLAIEIESLNKTFRGGRRALHVERLAVRPGEMVALIGSSGSGKSTLLRHICGLTVADRASGRLAVFGRTVQQDGRTNAAIRDIRSQIGVVFQQFNLVGRLSVLTNVLVGRLARIPLWRSLPRLFTAAERQAAQAALARVGIGEQADQRASTLSGGQQQRAAIARTLVQGAAVILADEPIASLDPESARRVMETLCTLNQQDGTTVMVSLHQVDMALRYCPRVVALRHGKIVFDGAAAELDAARLRWIYGTEAVHALEPTAAAPDVMADMLVRVQA